MNPESPNKIEKDLVKKMVEAIIDGPMYTSSYSGASAEDIAAAYDSLIEATIKVVSILDDPRGDGDCLAELFDEDAFGEINEDDDISAFAYATVNRAGRALIAATSVATAFAARVNEEREVRGIEVYRDYIFAAIGEAMSKKA